MPKEKKVPKKKILKEGITKPPKPPKRKRNKR